MSKFSFLRELSQTPRFVVYNKLNRSDKEPQNKTKVSCAKEKAEISLNRSIMLNKMLLPMFNFSYCSTIFFLILLYLYHLTIFPEQISK